MEVVRRMRPLLGTFAEVHAEGPGAAHAVDQAWRVIERAQRDWSVQDASSELSRLNATHGVCVPVHRHTLRLLRLACALMRRSGGAFDITVGGLLTEVGVLPEHGRNWLPRGHVDDIEIGRGWVRLHRPLRLTLDGVAKGFAVDLAVSALQRAGAVAGWVNAGGDVRAFGDALVPMHRREADGRLVPIGTLHQAALATSMVRSQKNLKDEQPGPHARWPAHILAPDGQAPAPGVWTVLAKRAWRADALTKVAAACPETGRVAVIRQLGGCLIEGAAIGAAQVVPLHRFSP
ncbi:FAD:protein FMN transferase [Aquabacterium parvum]|uniref:FAD:protein FMN transferase n=1 Tax=Aquabacterium parvum TaxID=70584 RepID=UPI000718D041|nr:FAD:protein FMN transferase [Aquabacterium parvum]